MSVSDFFPLLFAKNFAARRLRRCIAATFAACAICLAATDGNAMSNETALFAPPFMTSAIPAGIDEAAPASFASRFDCPQTSLIRDIRNMFDIPMYRASLGPSKAPVRPRRQKIVPAAPAIVGAASTYNPNDANDRDSGTSETASGEQYDAEGWTAAIRTDLRAKFGGVRFGKNYRPAYVLVESNDKQAIVRINDVGKLKRGRIIDLNQRAMRYFDPTLQLGVVEHVRVTPLAGQAWALGPVDDDQPVSIASSADKPAP
jgi:rare lipoprotein A